VISMMFVIATRTLDSQVAAARGLDEADLTGAKLSKANLSGASLWMADLFADLSGADLCRRESESLGRATTYDRGRTDQASIGRA
jgi:hypothetical protein